MSLYCLNSTKASYFAGKSQSDTSLSSVNITSTFQGNRCSTESSSYFTEKQRTYSMGWLSKVLDRKPDGLELSSETAKVELDGYSVYGDSSLDINNNEIAVPEDDSVLEVKGPSTTIENVFYTRKLKLDKLEGYRLSNNATDSNEIQITYSKKSKKRKANDLDPDENIQHKRKRVFVDDNRPELIDNEREFVDNNNNLCDDDELDAEVAMFMENSGPPTIWDNSFEATDREPTLIYQQETPSPWLRCIEGCYHRFRSPLGITTEPRKGAIRILDPWPCLYKNTKFGELNKAGKIDLDKVPSHWKRIGE